MFATILFDLGNVLVDFCHQRMCRQMGELVGWSGDEMHRWLIQSGLQWEFERGKLTAAEFRSQLESVTRRPIAAGALARAAGDIFSPRPEMFEVVQRLKAAGCRLVLLSNTCSLHIDWIAREYPLLKSFDQLVLSYEVGASKPDAAIYEVAMEAIACRPDQCLYVDDIAENIAAGAAFGLQVYHFIGPRDFLDRLGEWPLIPAQS